MQCMNNKRLLQTYTVSYLVTLFGNRVTGHFENIGRVLEWTVVVV